MADHFEILGIPRGFRVDEKRLEERHRELTRLLHPDRHAAAGATARRIALEKTIQVNDAWRVIKDPARRAAWLLREQGIDLGETGSSGASKYLPPGFLLEVMEERERFDDARAAKDVAAVERLAFAVREARAETLEGLGAAFDRDDYEEAARRLSMLRYQDRFLGEVRAWEDAIFEETHG
ncbi:Fe-S protein assembly co-chaperone HscB [Vulgatibacter incomptus]|uniref:Co-chaperone protein HscB homolog n=1 Tax=Vulgatibacter incomptus TaxID=1391653 RepID=A0A0K1PEG2_9BACT|nr:Fe-S protein assembly co-chaperone HscB [Vulgatibacter incomptus]AKU91900.1 Chaperone protein HscB [Vulgatibacter incomptus]